MFTSLNDLYVKMYSVENFGDWLLHELKEAGISQAELARRAGLSKGTVSNLINGTKGVGQDSLKAIARALRLSPEVVFRAAGVLPPKSESDPWVISQEYKLSKITDPKLRELAEKLIDSFRVCF